ncbi:MAG TPA: hypothetical protein VMN79_14575 [Casimicrobiaceae bacterium]|nr:hypothetical protein [Myxococcota bacterium]HTS23026.1 hypothetical protein [Casimicrobiaceae bacterium]
MRKLLDRAGVGTGIGSGLPVALCAALLLVASRGDASTLTLGAEFGPDQFSNAMTSAFSVTEGPDTMNFAEATGDPLAGTVGVTIVDQATFNETLNARALLEEQWQAICLTTCGTTLPPPTVAANLLVHLHGALSPNWNDANNPDTTGGVSEEIDVGADRFIFSIFPGAGAQVFVRACTPGPCVDFAPGSAGPINPDGSITVDFTQTFPVVVGPQFLTKMALSVGWEAGVTSPTFANMLDTATFTITSADPNFSFSSDGRAVPEPAALGSLALGLASFGLARAAARPRP